MIVDNWKKALEILNEARSLGKTIGYTSFQGSSLHNGHDAVLAALRDNCDFSICDCPPQDAAVGDPEFEFGLKWGTIRPYGIRLMSQDFHDYLGERCDLVVTRWRSLPDEFYMPEVKTFSDQYIAVRKQYDPQFMSDPILPREILQTSCFSNMYWFDKYVFHFDVRVCGWKEGLQRFIEKRLYEQVLGIRNIIIDPVSGDNGLCLSNTHQVSSKASARLVEFKRTQPLIRDISESRESLEERLVASGWFVWRFCKYSGELLPDPASTLFTVELLSVDRDGYYLESVIKR